MTEYYLQRLAFRLKPGSLSYKFHNVRVPEAWKQAVLDLQAEMKNRDRAKTTVPSDNLNRAIRAVFPDLIAIGKNAWQKGQPYWLLAEQPLSIPALTLLVREWISKSYATLPQHRLDHALGVVRDVPLVSIPTTVNLADWGEKHGTASYTAKYSGNSEIYNLLPHFVAAKFCRSNTPSVSWGDFNKPFLRVPMAYRSNGAELMSWPPEKHTSTSTSGATTTDYFSVLMTFTLQTIPFDPQPILHLDVGIRRWVSRPLKYLEGSASTYFYAPVSWLEGVLSHGFTVAPLHRYVSGTLPGGEKEWKSSWGKKDVLMQMLKRLHFSPDFPTANAIFDDPLTHLTSKSGVNAAMTWANTLNYPSGLKNHEIGVGLPPLDRLNLWEWVCRVVDPELEAVVPIPTTKLPLFTPVLKNPFFPGAGAKEGLGATDAASMENEARSDAGDTDINGDDALPKLTRVSVAHDDQQARCELLRSAVGNDVEIGLYYDSQSVRAGVEATLLDLFGAAPQTPCYRLPNGVTIHWNPVVKNGFLYDSLFVGDNPGEVLKRGQLRDATEQRRSAIKAAIAPATMPAVSIIELANKDDFSSRFADPKTAIRKGFAHTERLTQFLMPPPGNLPPNWQEKITATPADNEDKIIKSFRLRVMNAVLDALRQLGVQTPVTCRAKRAPLNCHNPLPCVHYVGYWLAKHTSGGSRTGIGGNLPLFVRVDGTTGEVTARAMMVEGRTKAQAWMPYRELLLRLGRDEYRVFHTQNDREQFVQYMKVTVQQVLLGEAHLLFAHAQNSRRDGWPYLANTQLQEKHIGFERDLTAERIEGIPGLRLLRVRDSDASETPESLVFENTPTGKGVLTFGAGKGI